MPIHFPIEPIGNLLKTKIKFIYNKNDDKTYFLIWNLP
jgi:hypothetical protein